MTSTIDPVELIRRPGQNVTVLRCTSCSAIQKIPFELPTGGLPCAACGQQLHASDLVEHATLRERLMAAFIDGVVWVAPVALILWGIFVVQAITEVLPEDENGDLTPKAVLAMRLLGVSLTVVYFWLIEAIGISPGKALMGLYVVRSPSWTRPGLRLGLLRLAGKLLVLASLGTVLLFAVRDSGRRALHDVLAGTCVLRR